MSLLNKKDFETKSEAKVEESDSFGFWKTNIVEEIAIDLADPHADNWVSTVQNVQRSSRNWQIW